MTVYLPSALRVHAGGRSSVALDVPAAAASRGGEHSLWTVLEALFAAYPGLCDRIVTERDNLRPHVALFVGSEGIRHTGGFETKVRDGAEVTISPAVSGG